jgi:hypothetical protein
MMRDQVASVALPDYGEPGDLDDLLEVVDGAGTRLMEATATMETEQPGSGGIGSALGERWILAEKSILKRKCKKDSTFNYSDIISSPTTPHHNKTKKNKKTKVKKFKNGSKCTFCYKNFRQLDRENVFFKYHVEMCRQKMSLDKKCPSCYAWIEKITFNEHIKKCIQYTQFDPNATKTLFVGFIKIGQNQKIYHSVLCDRFENFGQILKIDISPPDYALIHFPDIQSVVRAIHGMSNEYIFGSRINLGFGLS